MRTGNQLAPSPSGLPLAYRDKLVEIKGISRVDGIDKLEAWCRPPHRQSLDFFTDTPFRLLLKKLQEDDAE